MFFVDQQKQKTTLNPSTLETIAFGEEALNDALKNPSISRLA